MRRFTLRMMLMVAFMVLGMGSAWAETITVYSWNFTGFTADADVAFSTTESITEANTQCFLATDPTECAGLYFQGNWKRYKNNTGLRNVSGGDRMCVIPNLKAGDVVIITCDNTDYINTTKYEGTANEAKTELTATMADDGNFYFKFIKQNGTYGDEKVYPSIYSIIVQRSVEIRLLETKAWRFTGYLTDENVTTDSETTLSENNTACNLATAPSDCAGLYFQESWKRYKNASGLRNVSKGDRMCIVPNLKKNNVVVITCNNTDYINTTKYTGTANSEKTTLTFTMESDGNFYFKMVKAGATIDNVTVYPYITSIVVYEQATVVGAENFSTGYLGAISDLATLSPGSTAEFHFVNYNSYAGSDIANWDNFIVPVYDASDNCVIAIRADNWENVDKTFGEYGTNMGCSNNFNWDTFDSELNGATVDMIVNYTTDNVFQMWATITTSSGLKWKYYYSSDYNGTGIQLSGNIKTGLSVSTSYLLLKSWEYAAKVPMTLSSVGWATLYTPFALDFTGTGLTAYTATVANDQVTLAEVSSVPAYTGVVLKGDEGSYEIPVVASSTETNKGDLQGAPATDRWMSDDTDYYMLAYNSESDKVQFTKLTSGSIAAGKAYLVQAKNSTSGARTLNVVFAEGGTTGIQTLDKTQQADGACYNLNGQRVSQPAKGLYIVNGKKVVIK